MRGVSDRVCILTRVLSGQKGFCRMKCGSSSALRDLRLERLIILGLACAFSPSRAGGAPVRGAGVGFRGRAGPDRMDATDRDAGRAAGRRGGEEPSGSPRPEREGSCERAGEGRTLAGGGRPPRDPGARYQRPPSVLRRDRGKSYEPSAVSGRRGGTVLRSHAALGLSCGPAAGSRESPILRRKKIEPHLPPRPRGLGGGSPTLRRRPGRGCKRIGDPAPRRGFGEESTSLEVQGVTVPHPTQ